MNKQELIEKTFKETYRVGCQVLEDGKLPTKAHASDAGFDLYATSDIVIYPGQVKKHPLNIKLHLPMNCWAEITGKSGLGSKGLLVYAGVIDQDYRGVPHVVMSNINLIEGIDENGFPLMRVAPIVIKKGEKLAQMIMNPYSSLFYIEQVEEISADTSRGTGGFGSSGTV